MSDTSPRPPQSALRVALAKSGMRFTAQRGRVYDYLCSTTEHPTALDIYERVRAEIPAVSLGTIYKSLETLVGCGLAVRLAFEGGPTRYDARTDDHGHSRCLRCGAISDLPNRWVEEILQGPSLTASFAVAHYRLEISGLCGKCMVDLPCRSCMQAATCSTARSYGAALTMVQVGAGTSICPEPAAR